MAAATHRRVYVCAMSSQVTPESGQDSYLDTSRLARPELIGIGSALVLLISMWLPWFTTSSNPNSKITTAGIGPDDHANAWQTFSTLQWILLLICIAPIVLAWIVARRHSLELSRVETTAVSTSRPACVERDVGDPHQPVAVRCIDRAGCDPRTDRDSNQRTANGDRLPDRSEDAIGDDR